MGSLINKTAVFAVVFLICTQNATSQTLSEILSGDVSKDGTAQDNSERQPNAEQGLKNIRSIYDSKFAMGVMGGVNYNLLNHACTNINNSLICTIGELLNQDQDISQGRFSPYEQDRAADTPILKARGLGFAGRAFLDWSVNPSLGLRITAGLERFRVVDTTKPHEQITDRQKIIFNCGALPDDPAEKIFSTASVPCFAVIDYLTIEGLLRVKMTSYDDLAPWIGIGVVGLLPIRWNNNIVNDSAGLVPRSGFKAAAGLDVNLIDTRLFFPVSIDYTWLYKESNTAARDSMFSLTAGMGYRF